MNGMNATTGRAITGHEHLFQSIAKILTTPIGSCIERRDFGSELPNLIDAPNNAATRVRVYAATAGALMRFEPRLKLTRVVLGDAQGAQGVQVIDIEGIARETGDQVATSVPINQKAL